MLPALFPVSLPVGTGTVGKEALLPILARIDVLRDRLMAHLPIGKGRWGLDFSCASDLFGTPVIFETRHDGRFAGMRPSRACGRWSSWLVGQQTPEP